MLQIYCVDGWILWNIAGNGLNQSAEANPSILIFIAVVICTADYIILYIISQQVISFIMDRNLFFARPE